MKIFFPNNIWRFLLLIIVSLLVTSPIVWLHEVFETPVLQIVMMAVLCVAMTILYYLAAKKSGYQWLRKSELRINIDLREVLWAICFGILFTLGVFTYDHFVTRGDAASHIGVISFVGAILFGPIIEEWMFRGIFLKSMLTKTGERNAILISAIVFGLVHMGASLNPVKVVGAIGLGYYFGHIYAKHGSLVNTMILHSIVNAIGLVGVHFLYQP